MTKFTPHVVKIERQIYMTKFLPCSENSQIYTTCGENLFVHPLPHKLPGLCIKILDEATVSRLIFVCLSPKSRSHESEICGENLWCKFVVKICLCVPMESVCPCLFVPLW